MMTIFDKVMGYFVSVNTKGNAFALIKHPLKIPNINLTISNMQES